MTTKNEHKSLTGINTKKRNSAMRKMKILLVDDEERFLSTTKKLMLKKGYEVMTALNGAEALELLKKHIIGVVILDVKMPGMDGIATLREIKKSFPLVEVIMLTGHATVESAVEGLKLGAMDYLMKPTSIEDLIKKVEDGFEKRLKMEEKIRMAQTRIAMKSPRQIIQESKAFNLT